MIRQVVALHQAKDFSQAEALLRQAIARDPVNADLHNALGATFAALGRHLDAVWCYREAIFHNQHGPGIWTNLGNALTQLKYLKSAAICHQRALSLSGEDALLHHNFGNSLAEAGQHAEAIAAFTRAVEFEPNRHLARWDRGRSYLFLGNYAQAWPDYESRLVTGQLPSKVLPGQKWDGQPYAGKRLILVAEQGFGDALWVARYFQMAKALGGELTLECRPELIPLFEGMKIADCIIPHGTELPAADYHCYICSLPGLFTKSFASIPGRPHLSAGKERIEKFRAHFKNAERQLKVGVVWSGSLTFGKNHERAQTLLPFFQAFAMPGVQLYSLQKGPPEKELFAFPSGAPIINLSPNLNDFADTAAAVSHLDLVIMTDSAVAHLAGAMGKPIWLLLGHVAHWLWLLDRSDTPWYPSMRLFRPRSEGDWNYVFDSASAELMGVLKSR